MKTIHTGAALVALLVGALGTSSALAQKTYRCGNVFQSYPCALDNSTGGAGAKGAKPAAQSVKAPEPTAEEKKAEADKQAQLAEKQKQEAAAKEKKSRCDKIRNDLDYNTAQQKSAVSNTTMERLKADRKQIDADMKKEACPPAA